MEPDSGATLIARLQHHALATPERVAYTFLRDDGHADDLTYAALARRATLLAGWLSTRAAPGERVLLVYPAGLECIHACLACLLAGLIAVPAAVPHPTRHHGRLQRIVDDATPVLLLTHSHCTGAAGTTLPCIATDTLDLTAYEKVDLPPIVPAMTAFLQYTSGSTALPKGVEITHANIAGNAAAIAESFGFNAASVMVSWLPLFHDMGLIGSVVTPLYVGFHAVLMAPATFLKHPVRWLQAISQYRATCAGAPDFGWDLCVRKVRAHAGLDLSSLEVAYNGAEPVRASTLRAVAAAFAPCGLRATALFPCYGMAEATLLITGGPAGRAPLIRTVSKSMLEEHQVRAGVPGPDARDVVSCGRVAPRHEAIIVDPASRQALGPHRVGEVWVAGPGVARGYWNQPAETQAAFANYLPDGRGPFLRTGDLGFMEGGELFITGRLKDLVIINGRNIYPQDVEAVVQDATDCIAPNQCAAFALDIDGQERLAIVAEADRGLLRAGGQLDNIARHLCTLVARTFDVPVAAFVFVRPGALPRTTSGKVQRARCRELVWSTDVVYRMTVPVDAAASAAQADAMIAWLRQYAPRRLDSRLADERRTLAPHIVLDLGNQGFFGLQVPRHLGGAGLQTADLLRVMEQLAAIDLTVATLVGVHNGLGVRTVLHAGSPALHARLLPSLAGGRQLAAFALTEPGAGAHPAAICATAVQAPGGWIVNGEKQWIGLAAWAGVITVFARAVDAAGHALGTVALLVAEDTPGLVQGPEALTMGMRGMVQNTVYLVDAFVPDSALLAAPGAGMDVARDAMQFARLGIAAICIGGMKRCAQLMARYAARRTVATGRLLDHPVTLARLQETSHAIAAVAALVDAIAAELDNGRTVPAQAYLACKTAAAELFGQVADALVQVLGGRGYIETNTAPQILRDARVLRILEGPTETLYAHLGATLGQGDAVHHFIEAILGSPDVAMALASMAATLRGTATPGSASMALQQWLDYRLGELAAAAFLLAAAEHRAHGAVAWARRRFELLGQAILDDLAHRTDIDASAMLEIVAGYSAAIGDIDQAAPGTGQAIDPLLQRAHPAGQVTPPPRPATAASTLGIVHDAVAAWLRAEQRTAQQVFDADTPFAALGIDSLATASIAANLEQRTGIPVHPEVFHEHQTARALAAWLDAA